MGRLERKPKGAKRRKLREQSDFKTDEAMLRTLLGITDDRPFEITDARDVGGLSGRGHGQWSVRQHRRCSSRC
jgi:hypothetical protein